jgi:hypothetical protein
VDAETMEIIEQIDREKADALAARIAVGDVINGVEQLTDPAAIKAMRPEQIVQAQRDGRLVKYLSTPRKSR